MNTRNDNFLSFYEKVVHMAFGCGCVRTFHVERQMTAQRCITHGDHMISSTEEWVPRQKHPAVA